MEGRRSPIDVWPAFSDFLSSSLLVILMVLVVTLIGSAFQRSVLLLEKRQLESDRRDLQERLDKLEAENRRIRKVIRERRGLVRVAMQKEKFAVDPADENDELNSQTIVLQESSAHRSEFFESGETVLKDGLKRRLDRVVAILDRHDDWFELIRVDGHTDDVPNPPDGNWVLSAGRAARVVDYLLGHSRLLPWRVAATGRAEFQPQSLRQKGAYSDPSARAQGRLANPRHGPNRRYVVEANTSEEGRAHNRRIEIHLDYVVPGR